MVNRIIKRKRGLSRDKSDIKEGFEWYTPEGTCQSVTEEKTEAQLILIGQKIEGIKSSGTQGFIYYY